MTSLARPAAALAALLLALPAAAGAAEVIALLPATGVNVDAGTLEASREVMRGHLMRTGLEVRPAATATPDLEPSPVEAGAAASGVGAGRAAVLRLVTLGGTLRARLTVYDLAGRQVHADEMAANAVTDLDPALERLAKGYAKGSSAAKTADLDTMTEKEAAGVQKAEAASAFGVRLGGLRATGTSGSDVGATGGGIYWFYDSRSFLIDVTVDGYWAKSTHHVASGFGGYLPLSKGNFAPYLGGGLRYAWADYGDGGGRGFQADVALGILLGRLSTASIRGEVQYWWNLYETGGQKASGAGWSLGVQF